MRRAQVTCLFVALTVALVVGPALPATAAPEDLVLVSAAPDGTKGNADSVQPSVSADGVLVAYETVANNLHPDDDDALLDVYVRDVTSGEVILVSRAANGDKGNGPSYAASISADGTRVAFVSEATNLDPDDGDAVADVYVVELASGDITLASVTAGGTKANADCARPSLDADGSRVAFDTRATALLGEPAGDPTDDVLVKDLDSGELLLASADAAGTKANGFSIAPSISADGTRVAFQSTATNLDAAQDDSSDIDVYVKDLDTGEVLLASITAAGVKGNNTSSLPSLAADGSVVAFASSATILDPDDTDIFSDVYVKDLASGELALASITADGVKGNSNSGADAATVTPGMSLSADGSRVAFHTEASNLANGDPGELTEVLVKDLETGEILIASSRADGSPGSGLHPSITADGVGVAFDSGDQDLDLEPDPDDRHFDVYLKGPPVDETRASRATAAATSVAWRSRCCQLLFPRPTPPAPWCSRATTCSLTPWPARRWPAMTPACSTPPAGPSSRWTRSPAPRSTVCCPPAGRSGSWAGPRPSPRRSRPSSPAPATPWSASRAPAASRPRSRSPAWCASENPGGTDALLAWGLNFPDAVTGGAYGARTGTPILLTDTAELHPATAAALGELSVQRTFVLGGDAVISPTAAAQAPNPVRVAGVNRMATAATVATVLWGEVVPDVSTVVLCNIERADGWALTLAAAPLSARDGAPQLGVGTDTYPAETNGYLQGLEPPASTAYVMGNEEFISEAVVDQAAADLAT